MKRKKLFVIILLLFTLTVPFLEAQESEKGKKTVINVNGTVLSAEDGLPIIGATIQIQG